MHLQHLHKLLVITDQYSMMTRSIPLLQMPLFFSAFYHYAVKSSPLWSSAITKKTRWGKE